MTCSSSRVNVTTSSSFVEKKDNVILTGPWERFNPKGQIPVGGTGQEEAMRKASCAAWPGLSFVVQRRLLKLSLSMGELIT